MAKQLLDNFFRSKLNNMDYPYSEENWANMEKMLSKNQMPGKLIKSGASKFLKYYIAAGVTVVGLVGIFCITNMNSDKATKIEIKPTNEQIVNPVENVKNSSNAVESLVVTNTVQKKKTFRSIKKVEEFSVPLENDDIAADMDVNSMMSSITDEKVITNTHISENTVTPKVEKPNVAIENIDKSEPVKPKPVPAAELMKKKRGLLYYLGIRRR